MFLPLSVVIVMHSLKST